MAIFAFLATFSFEYFFTQSPTSNFMLGLGTGICTFVIVFILHYFIFQKLRSKLLKYLCLVIFPMVYLAFLISTFGAVTLLIDLTLFHVAFINQIFLQIWAFLGKAYIYAAFSPKTPFALTSLLVVLSFFCALKNSHTQTDHD